MLVKVEVLLDVSWWDGDLVKISRGDPLTDRLEASVTEAVEAALKRQQGDGFCHDMENIVSLIVDDVSAKLV